MIVYFLIRPLAIFSSRYATASIYEPILPIYRGPYRIAKLILCKRFNIREKIIFRINNLQ